MASSTAAAVPVHGEAGLYDVEAPLQQQQHELEQLPPPLDTNNLGDATTGEEDRAAEQQSYPLGQSHTPLTSIPTLGQALIEGTNIDRKYVHSFLQVLADHSQFSDKYQHYEEDEYERKRKRKLRESERKMFFYAGQGGSLSGDAKPSKRRASAAASSTAASDLKNSASKKRRRRDQDRDRVLDKDARRQLLGGSAPAVLAAFSAAGSLPAAAAAAAMGHADLVLDVDHSPASSSSSPAQTPPSGYGYVDQRAASMPNMLAGSWDSFGHLHQPQLQQQQVHHQPPPQQQQQFYAQQQHFVQQQQQHQAAGHAMLRQARVPHQSYQPLQRFHASTSSSASLDYMPQMSPASSSTLSSSLPSSSSSYQLSSCYSSPAHSPQQPAADGAYYHQQQHYPLQPHAQAHFQAQQQHQAPRAARMAVSLPAEMLSAAYHQHQVHHHHHHHGYPQHHSEAMSGLMMGGGASLDVDGDEAWMSSSSSSLSADACPSAAGGELPAAGSESFSSFGPYVDPATGGLVVGDAAAAHDGGMLACADMSAAAAAAAAAVEHFMHSNLHHQPQHEESSPEGQQLQGGAAMDEDWLNSFFSDDCSPTLLGGGPVAPGSANDNAAGCGLDTNHLDSLFADMENFYGRLVN